MATASSSASPSFLDKTFSFFCVRSSILLSLLLLFRLCRSVLLQWRSPSICVALGLREQTPTPTRGIRHHTGLVSRGGYKSDYVSKDHSDHLRRLSLGLLRTSAGTE